jgi:hypothetical protein
VRLTARQPAGRCFWAGFITSALQLLVAHVMGSPRGQELGKAGMIGSVLGLVAVFYAPQIMASVHAAFGS